MPAVLVLVFILVPLAEILVILQVGAVIGGWWTAVILVADSLLGAYLLRVEGRRAWREFRTALEEGRWPGDEVAQGALIIVGGTLLLTPGFLTDAIGFLFLLGPTRRIVSRRLRARVGAAATGGPAAGSARGSGGTPPPGSVGTGHRSRTGPGNARSRDDDELELDVEVVEIRREQPPLRPTGEAPRSDDDGAGGQPPTLDDQDRDRDRDQDRDRDRDQDRDRGPGRDRGEDDARG
jgi:UPF0716 protein FxsA